MKEVMEKVSVLFQALVKKDAEVNNLNKKLAELSSDLDEQSAKLKNFENSLLVREAKVKEVENVLGLLAEAKELKQASAEEKTEAESIKKDAKLFIEQKERDLAVKFSNVDALKKGLESQQQSLNKEAARLKNDYAVMREKIIKEIKGNL